ncbi:MAG: Peptidase [Frankiales bacterium]|nr:Peptidase [Frankiales bacterium]
MRRPQLSSRARRSLPPVLVALGLVVGVGGVLTAQTRTLTARSAEPSAPTTTPTPPAVVRVAALKQRVPAHLIVLSKLPLSVAQQRRLVRATGAKAALAVSAGTVTVGTGRTTVLGVDPSAFRAWTPKGTAESDPVWQSVAAGDGAVAHAVARAFKVPLGGTVTARVVHPVRLRVGSYATTALPGIGLVVNADRGAELGLVPRTGLLLSVPQRDSDTSAQLARGALAPGMSVSAVQYERQRIQPGGWVVPAVGRVSSGFGPRLEPLRQGVGFHDGIDIAAPLGAPVYAMSDGVVLYAGPASGFGTEVVLSHKGGVTTVYGHVSRVLVTSGPVRAGQVIALVGSEGESTGPHLHAEVRVNDRPVDPIAWLRAHGVPI